MNKTEETLKKCTFKIIVEEYTIKEFAKSRHHRVNYYDYLGVGYAKPIEIYDVYGVYETEDGEILTKVHSIHLGVHLSTKLITGEYVIYGYGRCEVENKDTLIKTLKDEVIKNIHNY